VPGRQAAGGLAAWARAEGVSLRIEDAGSEPAQTACRYRALAGTVDLLFGPYGSGPMQAVAEALAGRADVVVNHGGAVHPETGARVVSVIGPADRYWAGLADVLADDGVPLDRVAVLHAASGFGRTTASGAVASLAAAGARPVAVEAFDAESAAVIAARVLHEGAAAVVGCGRIEDDLALGRALAGTRVAVGLVVCGVSLAAEALGDAVEGWFGPAQWWPDGPPPPIALPPGADYPAAQALAAGLVAGEIVVAAGTTEPDAVWDAARRLRTETFLGPFAVDAAGRQVAHAPHLVRWVRRRAALVRERCWSPVRA
jgi:branched-chain amino acid transport system substrate-binding protein